jgi:hypothetical protein
MEERARIEERIAALRERLEEMQRNIPGHSTSIHHVAMMEDLEDEIEKLLSLLTDIE